MMLKIFVSLLFLSFVFNTNAAATKNLRWKIKNKTWSRSYEKAFEEFVQLLGEGRKNNQCKTTNECLRSKTANPHYYHLNPIGLKNVFSDCADLPFVLRAYFAWMNDLPFGYPTQLVEAKSFSRRLSDIRYSRYGNIVTAKKYVKDGDNFNNIVQEIVNTISTASYRTNASLNDNGNLFRDTYPVDIDRLYIKPGTVLYDPNGHVAMVYNVTANGRILLIDAHPDNSLTAIQYGEKFARTGLKVGAGFSNFRSFSMGPNGIVTQKNAELSGYSLIQYSTGPFVYKDEELNFYEYVRAKMSDGIVVYDPINEFKDYMDGLCQDTQDRNAAVSTAIESGIDKMDHPDYLPANIYGTDGEWEIYSTPSRDARLKASVREVYKFLNKITKLYFLNDPVLLYDRDDLISELRNIYWEKSRNCTVEISKQLSIDLDFVLQKLFDLSFDPYHCKELRWGIINSSDCQISNIKKRWYTAEQGLRNRIDRDYSLKTNYDVESLPKAPASQVERPNISFDDVLRIER